MLGDLRGGLKKLSFSLYWVLLGSRSILRMGYVKKSYLDKG